MDSLLNPCGEISLQNYKDYCQLMMPNLISSISMAVAEDRQKVDNFMSEFGKVLGNKKKNKKNWRSIDDEWMPTKTEW